MSALYWLTGWMAWNPGMTALNAMILIAFIVWVASWLQWEFIRRKIKRVLDSCLGLEKKFNLNEEWLRNLRDVIDKGRANGAKT